MDAEKEPEFVLLASFDDDVDDEDGGYKTFFDKLYFGIK